MQALKFTLSGKTAFFKRPEVNTYYYFTFGNIHKVALLGMFGAILGYRGYNNTIELPEFYQKLKDIKLSILPRNEKGYFSKKIQYYNNSVGYASKEQGGNLIIKEQWLEDVSWDIVVLMNNEEADKLAHALINRKCEYIPYLGKNDHPANITDPVIVNLEKHNLDEEALDCLFPKSNFEEAEDVDIDINFYKYQESLPIGLNEKTGLYEYMTFIHTNLYMDEGSVYSFDEKNIVFY